jgi:hypothetical protein
MAHQRADHTATLLAGGRVLVVAGQDGFAVYTYTFTNTAEVYARASLAPPMTVPAMPLSSRVLAAAGLGLVGIAGLKRGAGRRRLRAV